MENKTDQAFEREVLQRLSRIEEAFKWMSENCAPRGIRLEAVERTALTALDSVKSAHHRIDDHKQEVAAEFEEMGKNIKRQIDSVYRTALIVGSVSGFFIGIIIKFL